ncbi:MAG TPA: PD-(D/E)XK nuclease family protein [Solirubrobacteraceae bacterium]|jgi:ATP-dependent helicase/DNAse subunit B|nr:PD-(D/E)XK nuclease family protein [Solirubrobacteraceae bacterium]
MSITLVTGPANSGKAQVVMDAVRRHLAQGEEPILVVPTAADVEHYLRELAGREAAVGVRVGVFSALIDELVLRAGVREPVLGALARERLIATLAACGGQEGRPGFRRALAELFGELQVGRVTPQRLAAALAAGFGDGEAALGFDLAGAYGEYRRLLDRLGRLDEQQRALLALDRLRERPYLWAGPTPVHFYGFDDLTALQLDAIETLGRVLDAEVTVSLPYEAGRVAFAGRAGTFESLAPLARHLTLTPRQEHYAPASRAALSHLERSLFEPGAARVDPGRHEPAIELLQGGGERAELELIAARVAQLLDRGMPAEEIAVVVRHPAALAPLVGEVFGAAGIPYATPVKRPFADTAAGRALIGLLRCVAVPGGAAPGTPADLLAWLRAPGQLEHPEMADSLELELRRAGLRTVAQARARWEDRRFPLEMIDRIGEAQQRGPAALAERAARELLRLFAAPRRGRAAVLGAEEMDEARALAGGRKALAELRELARFAPAAAPSTAGELASVLAGLEVNSGELPGPSLVAVLDPLALRARRVRALFLSGLQEGVFPMRARPQPLLGERERARVAQASGLLLGAAEDVLAAERYLFYALVSRPTELLALSWHETDDDAAPLSRSLFVDDVCDLFDESLEQGRERRALGALDAARPAASAAAAAPAGGHLADERVLARLRARAWSGTSIEKWVGCPVKWFVEGLLAPERFEPESEPLARGGLAHLVLSETLTSLREQTGSARVTPATRGRARELMHAALDAARADGERRVSVSPERAAALVRSLRADLERYIDHAAELEGSLVPRELELGFGFDEPGEEDHGERSELPAFDLGGGVRLRGRIDRIDVGAGGEAVVVDYKAKTAPPREKWVAERNLQVALYMQAAEQLLGVRVVGGLYQPLAGKDLRARGVLLDDHDAAGNCVRTDRIEAEELDELLAEVLDIARTAAGEAGRGELEPRPDSCGFGGRGCMYPTICRCER